MTTDPLVVIATAFKQIIRRNQAQPALINAPTIVVAKKLGNRSGY